MKKTNTRVLPIVLGLALIGGAAASYVNLAFAETTASSTGPPAGHTQTHNKRHSTGKPKQHELNGVVTALSGTTTITIQKTGKGGVLYTIDASGAAVMKDGVASPLSSVIIGDKIFVKGTVNGTNITATVITDGHAKHAKPKSTRLHTKGHSGKPRNGPHGVNPPSTH